MLVNPATAALLKYVNNSLKNIVCTGNLESVISRHILDMFLSFKFSILIRIVHEIEYPSVCKCDKFLVKIVDMKQPSLWLVQVTVYLPYLSLKLSPLNLSYPAT